MTWTPLQPATAKLSSGMLALVGSVPALAQKYDEEGEETFMNESVVASRKLVEPVPGWPQIVHVSFRTTDRDALVPYDTYVRIKNEIIDPMSEAIEIFPAESRLVDTANQFHFWAFQPGAPYPVGLNPVARHPRCPRIAKVKKLPPLQRARSHFRPPRWTKFSQLKIDLSKAAEHFRRERPPSGVFVNSRYEVWAYRWEFPIGPVVSLAIRRHDGHERRDWRDLQRIKNEILGPETEAVDLLPAFVRDIGADPLFDFETVLWGLPPGFVHPFGLSDTRLLSDTSSHGAVQRRFDDDNLPADVQDAGEILKNLLSGARPVDLAIEPSDGAPEA